jgi:hypothetical protein
VECSGSSAASFRGLRVRVRPGRIVPRERPPNRCASAPAVRAAGLRAQRQRRRAPQLSAPAKQAVLAPASPATHGAADGWAGNLTVHRRQWPSVRGWSGRPGGQARPQGRHGARVPGAATRCRLVGMTAGRRRTKRGAMGLTRAGATGTGRGPLGLAELPPTLRIVHVAAAGLTRGCRAAGGPAPR